MIVIRPLHAVATTTDTDLAYDGQGNSIVLLRELRAAVSVKIKLR